MFWLKRLLGVSAVLLLAVAVVWTFAARQRETSAVAANPAAPPVAAPTQPLAAYPALPPTPPVPTRALPAYPIATVIVAVPTLTPLIAQATTTPQPVATAPTVTLPRPGTGPSRLQYTTTHDRARQFLELRFGGDLHPISAAAPVSIPSGLGFESAQVWLSPTGQYALFAETSFPCCRLHVADLTRGIRDATVKQFGGGKFYGWHPNGRHFVIESGPIWLVDAETLKTVKLAETVGAIQGAAISPDGNTVAYGADNLPASLYGVWLVSSTGGPTNLLMNEGAYIYPNAWAPDNARLIVLGGCPATTPSKPPTPHSSESRGTTTPGALCIVDIHTKARQALAIPYTDYEPNWSPDGRYVAATGWSSQEPRCTGVKGQPLPDSCAYTGQSIYLADVATGEIQEITAGIAPVWSPDGSTIAFLSNRSGSPEVWAIDIGQRQITQITSDGGAKGQYGQLMWLKEARR